MITAGLVVVPPRDVDIAVVELDGQGGVGDSDGEVSSGLGAVAADALTAD
jgi:hypothetical protein